MKKLLTLILFLLPIVTFGQFTTLNPDTVCYQSNGSIYNLPNTPGYVYNWNVLSPGILSSGQGTNQINVNWSGAAPGLIINAVTVSATSGGCVSPTVNLNVFIYQVIPTIVVVGPFCSSDQCVNLVGSPVGGIFAGNGVVGGQFCPGTSGPGIHVITYTYINGGCTFTATINIIVNLVPVLSPIQHN